jgi:endo-1,4-beta-xylanase
LQADWMESVFTLAYSKPYIEAANWFDFLDPHSYMENGGLLRSPEGETKATYDRIKKMKERWGHLPAKK